MAEKGFGVKEINLIGASGTPTIESPNNLNLNAVNVAISTNATIGGNLTVSGTVGIAGTLTYEDVTNVDAVGIVTAREGVFIPDNKELKIGNTAGSPDFSIKHDTSNTILDGNTGDVIIRADGDDLKLLAEDDIVLRDNDDNTNFIHCINGGKVILYHAGSQKFETNNAGISVTGQGVFSSAITASTYIQGTSSNGGLKFYSDSSASKGVVLNTDDHLVPSNDSASDLGLTGTRWRNLYADTLYGDGSNLTGIAVTEAPVTDYTISANGSSAYRIHGGGVDETADDPDLYLVRGQKYRFNNTTGSSHPFAIREASGGSAYTDGVTGSQNGIQFFTVPYDAPASLFYQCTIHSGMVGNIYIRGAGGQNTNVGITTFSGMAFFRDDLTVSSSGLAVNIFESTDNHSRFRIKSGSSSLAQLEFADQDDADAGEIRYDHGNDRMTFHVNNNTERIRIDSYGVLRVGNTHSQTTSGNTKRIALGAKASIWGWVTGQINGALTLADNYYWDGANNKAIESDYCAYLSLRSGSMRFGCTAASQTGGQNISGGIGEKVRFENNGNVSIADGNLILASGHGIDFSATSDGGNSSTSSSELLDDYEEGSWTPVIKGSSSPGTATYVSRSARYVKVGRLVHVYADVRWSAHNGSGGLEVHGLPYAQVGGYWGHFGVNYNSGMTYATDVHYGWANINGDYIRYWETNSSGGSGSLSLDPVVGEVHFYGHYLTTA